MTATLDVAVVGAGPAGLAAATLCAERGLSTSLYDEHGAPGGQIYRGVTTASRARAEFLGEDYWRGATLVPPFERSGARYVPAATVWALVRRDDGTFGVTVSVGAPGTRFATTVEARAVILAAGALERPFPIPGWTLPGVLAAGGAQLLLKTASLVPRGRVVLAGSGPLLWLLATQYLRAGVQIAAFLDTTPRGRLAQAAPLAPGFMLSPYLAKGLDLVRFVRRRARVVEYVSELAVEGRDAAEAIRFRHGSHEETLAADLVLLHQGIVPDVQLAGAAGCALAWNDAQACFTPVVDAWGGTSVPGLYVAGDGAGIAGAEAAEARGRLTALAVANAVGRIDGAARDAAAQRHRRDLAQAMRGRAFLDALYRPADAFRIPHGDTIACRCEEVTAATVLQLARDGCAGPNQMKAYTRCGMGPCQGRFCGLTVTELIAHAQRRRPADVGALHARFPVKPVALAELAALPATDEALRAVVRTAD